MMQFNCTNVFFFIDIDLILRLVKSYIFVLYNISFHVNMHLSLLIMTIKITTATLHSQLLCSFPASNYVPTFLINIQALYIAAFGRYYNSVHHGVLLRLWAPLLMGN